MTDDDRQKTHQGGAQGEGEVGALLGGLLDGLPESGHSAGGERPANPFRDAGPAASVGSSGQGSEPSSPTDAPPPTGSPVSTDADPDPLGLASPTGLLAPTQQTWRADGADGAEAEGVPDGPVPPISGGYEAREAESVDEARPAPGTSGVRADDEALGGHSIPSTVAGDEVPGVLGVQGVRGVQGGQEDGESAGTHHAPGPPAGDTAPSGVTDPEVTGGPDRSESEPDTGVAAGGDVLSAGEAAPEAPATPSVPAGDQAPGMHTTPDPSGAPRADAAAPPAVEPRSAYDVPDVSEAPSAFTTTATGGAGGTGGHAVPAVAGGHASGTDGNTEPYGVRASGIPAAHGNTGSEVPSDAASAPGPHAVDAVEGPGHTEVHGPSEGAPDVNGAPDGAGDPTPPEDARGVSEVVGVAGVLGEAVPVPVHPGRARVSGEHETAGSGMRPDHVGEPPGDTQVPEAGGHVSGDTQVPDNGEPTQEGARPPAPAETPVEAAQENVPPAPVAPVDHTVRTPTADAPEHGAASQGQAYADAEREALYRAIRERRDVHSGFRPERVADDLLVRILEAAHQAPGVDDTKPWDFLVVDDRALRTRVHDLARDEREEHARSRSGTRAQAFSGLGAEAILEAPLNIAVTVDPTRGPRPTPGGRTSPRSASHAAAPAVENLWLAARAEGLGVGWIPFPDEREVARALDLPPHLDVVAYLCVGHVDEFPTEPEPGLAGRVRERPLSWAVHHDRYGRRGLPGQEPTSLLEETIAAIGGLSARAVEEARDRQRRMSKPPGALGVLEEVSVRLAGLSGECPPPIPEPAAVAIFAGDHGVHAQGVTPWPQEVTAQMVGTFLAGGAVVNAFAEQVGADVTVVDVGVAADLPSASGLLPRKVARGTADATQGPAMTRPQALQALETGIEVARDLVASGHRCLVTGDMGIANTTPSAALICAYTGAAPEEATGKGAGADEKVHENKVDVVRRMLAANPVEPSDPVGTLAALGGLEHAALAGFVLGGAAMRVPVLLDGVIAGSSALAAAAISPESAAACFAGHRSSEPGHATALEHLGLPPLVDLELRVGEGSGALLALPLLQASARALGSVATFEDAGITSAG
ncbi:nicotinate-nucleotide--dimethylbenzimidazole phosphoribosyltransferase [Nocardiopsis xinjiangensis]|uniref:nicotinate-nucleotide--dimethylbenzimidazole phosphoribosyltransferase n=1 Tax=Nocardiopsis xinjiangensis TaxID=124285 RepID=UPI000372D5A8|nr:nicotinate-nucleotide--dimethylbenzimidazole phosphoribosyltransferase [Nocardiopsis xinjiangensis]